VTTVPATAFPLIGEVVILVPARKSLLLLTIPVILPSLSCLNLLRTGMLSFGAAAFFAAGLDAKGFFAGAFLATGAFLTTGVCFGAAGLGAPKNPKLDLAGGFFSSTTGAGAGFLGDPPPNRPEVQNMII